ncbi:MAG: hypothetical protein EB127_08615 [Alphaproteobacteria bacterium]|nr:hypothetical protein [Alphaproteobacteria bacterium]
MLKKSIITAFVFTASLVSTSAIAHGPHHYSHHHNNWIGPAIASSIVTYALTRPHVVIGQPTVIQQPAVIQQSHVSIQQGNCLINVYNPYMQRYENVVVTCNQPLVQPIIQ